MLCYFKKGQNTTETQEKDLCSVGRRGCDVSTASKVFLNFRAADFSLDGAPWPGRPDEVDSGQMETLTENNECFTTWERVDTLKTSQSIVIGENEKCVFYFKEKNHTNFLANPIHSRLPQYWEF